MRIIAEPEYGDAHDVARIFGIKKAELQQLVNDA
jgi:hypothetical protein